MENVTIEARKYTDGSKAWYLNFWSNEAELFYSLKITAKQFEALRKRGFPISKT